MDEGKRTAEHEVRLGRGDVRLRIEGVRLVHGTAVSDANERESIEVLDLLPRLERITPAIPTQIVSQSFHIAK